MLILSRREDESVIIGDDVVVTVIEIKGGQVRLGISAPRSVVVDREEIRKSRLHDASKQRIEQAVDAT